LLTAAYTEDLSYRWLIIPLILLYILHLGGVGMLGPDEPRYASIGREMAHSWNLITPRLDGMPWFEKPPLLYWLVAIGHWLHLPGEWAPRLPVALLSVVFLAFFYQKLEREFSSRRALIATAILATSAGWIAYSFAALTDLPMSAALSAAMLITLFDTRSLDEKFNRGWIVGVLLGLAILGKGFVPVVLFAPLLLVARGKRAAILGGAFLIAAPWHIWCLIVNGSAFWNDYFWKQHVARFLTPELEHVQPFWYYVPILLAGLFPWTPLAALLAKGKIYDDVRIRVFAGWVLYGLLFFSISRNKLPGYVLPLMPALAIVLAAGVEKARRKEFWLAACAVLLVALPTLVGVLPVALLSGIRRTNLSFSWGGLLFLIAAALVWWMAREEQTEWAVIAVAIAVSVGVVYMKYAAFPALDRGVSVRAFYRANQSAFDGSTGRGVCLANVRRSWEYGLNYYAPKPIPVCGPEPVDTIKVEENSGRLSVAFR
jgi:4-amino-4-deoxy-L-arabinose transferase-like glycosyltransferase